MPLATVWLGCGAAAPPEGAEYPALVLPVRREAPAPHGAGEPASRASAAAARRERAPAGSGPPSAAPASAAPRAEPLTPEGATPGAELAPAGSEPRGPQRSAHGDLPDPAPLSQRAQWSYPIAYDRGVVTVGRPELVCLPRPRATPRRIGRYAFELWLGRELIDRVRFDFPLLATEEPAPASARRPIHDPPRFAPGARVSVVLSVPASARATRASLLDRATGEVIDVTWPPRAADGAPLSGQCPAAPARR